MICSIKKCGRIVLARNYCTRHYKKWRKYGKATAGKTNAPPGSGTIDSDGYRKITVNGKVRFEHIVVAERALGRRLPCGVQIHHWNENKADSRGLNLVICPSAAYHKLLHKRARAYDACGHADWIKCNICKKWDSPENVTQTQGSNFHLSCSRKYQRSGWRVRNERQY